MRILPVRHFKKDVQLGTETGKNKVYPFVEYQDRPMDLLNLTETQPSILLLLESIEATISTERKAEKEQGTKILQNFPNQPQLTPLSNYGKSKLGSKSNFHVRD